MNNNTILVNYTGRKGGGPLDAIEITRAFLNIGLQVVAIVSDQIENLEKWEELNLLKLVKIPTYDNKREAIINSILFRFKTKKYIQNELSNIKIEYIYCPMGCLWTNKINKMFPNAKKAIVIHDPIPHSGEKNIISKFEHYKYYDFLIVHSKTFVSYVKNKYKKDTYYVPLGRHNIYKYCNNKQKIISYDPTCMNYVFFGRISKYKGLDVLADAYNEVQHELKGHVSLSVVGAGDFKQYENKYKGFDQFKLINKWIKDEETESVFLGENLVCVCPYVDATQSGVVLVAMDYGVPVIATKTGGLCEQIEDHVTGILVEPQNAKELSEAMIELAENKQLYNDIRKNESVEIEKLSWDIIAKQIVEIFEDLH